jgi:hypothetical protein
MQQKQASLVLHAPNGGIPQINSRMGSIVIEAVNIAATLNQQLSQQLGAQLQIPNEKVKPPRKRRRALSSNVQEDDQMKKIKKAISKCPHGEKSYYANGMCKNCYHAKGRKKLASTCGHPDRILYAKGQCKNCYLSRYHKTKRVD